MVRGQHVSEYGSRRPDQHGRPDGPAADDPPASESTDDVLGDGEVDDSARAQAQVGGELARAEDNVSDAQGEHLGARLRPRSECIGSTAHRWCDPVSNLISWQVWWSGTARSSNMHLRTTACSSPDEAPSRSTGDRRPADAAGVRHRPRSTPRCRRRYQGTAGAAISACGARSARSDLHELVVDPVVNTSGARRTLTNSGEQIPDASTIVRFGRGAPGGRGVAGSNPVSPTNRIQHHRTLSVGTSSSRRLAIDNPERRRLRPRLGPPLRICRPDAQHRLVVGVQIPAGHRRVLVAGHPLQQMQRRRPRPPSKSARYAVAHVGQAR